jgi:hypothetical protein
VATKATLHLVEGNRGIWRCMVSGEAGLDQRLIGGRKSGIVQFHCPADQQLALLKRQRG